MASPQITELVVTLLKSPRGLTAVLAVIGSLVAFVYLFILKGEKSSSKRSSSNKRKQATSKSSPAKKSPNKSLTKPKVSKKESTPDGGKVAKVSKTTPDKKDTKKSPAKDSQAAVARNEPIRTKQTRRLTSGSGSQAAQKDDGEWITVAKKKPRASTSKKNKDNEDSSPSPQTRTSTRRFGGDTRTPNRN